MRFSLTTLLLVAFWIAAVMLVWVRREPWNLDYENTLGLPLPMRTEMKSNDGTRLIVLSHMRWEREPAGPVVVYSLVPYMKELTEFGNAEMRGCQFIDDDTIACIGDPNRYWRYKRRFPEWWWGHFYRPEVWLAIALTGVLLWRVRAALKRRTVPSGTKEISPAL